MTAAPAGPRSGALRHLDPELAWGLALLALACVGWWLHSLPLALVGALGALTAGTLYVWQRDCLTAVTYRRTLGATRADFGEKVALDVEIVNDKLLPVPWLHTEETVPARLRYEGGTVTGDGQLASLVNVLPLLPYQRVRRHVTVTCRERGVHRFGAATLRSGDPVGLRSRTAAASSPAELLVYPKVFALTPTEVASRAPGGAVRVRRHWFEDPSRIAGVREYRAGDPLRSVDWRATARATSGLLVRRFEPTVDLGVAVLLDLRVPRELRWVPETSQTELAVAVAASVLSDLAARRVAVGLYAAASVDGEPLAFAPGSSPGQLPLLLEALARCEPMGDSAFPSVVLSTVGRLRQGTSVIVVASHFTDATLVAMAELRRRHAVTALWVHGRRGDGPGSDQVDGLLQAEHTEGWRDDDTLELAA